MEFAWYIFIFIISSLAYVFFMMIPYVGDFAVALPFGLLCVIFVWMIDKQKEAKKAEERKLRGENEEEKKKVTKKFKDLDK